MLDTKQGFCSTQVRCNSLQNERTKDPQGLHHTQRFWKLKCKLSTCLWRCSDQAVRINQQCRRLSLIPGLGRSPGEENGKPLQYSCLENPLDRGACRLESMGSQESDVTERLNRQPPVTRLYKDEGRGQTQWTHHFTSSDLALWLLGLRTASGAEE